MAMQSDPQLGQKDLASSQSLKAHVDQDAPGQSGYEPAVTESVEVDPVSPPLRALLAQAVLPPGEKQAEEGRQILDSLPRDKQTGWNTASEMFRSQLTPTARRSLPGILRKPYTDLKPAQKAFYNMSYQLLLSCMTMAGVVDLATAIRLTSDSGFGE